MGSDQSAAKFHDIASALSIYGDTTVFIVSIPLAIGCFGAMHITQGWRNYTIILLLTSILVFSISYAALYVTLYFVLQEYIAWLAWLA